MNLNSIIENIPPAFYGVIIGALLTIIGVLLTNSSNTKRLRIQHEFEREIRNKERDLNLRRDVYMDAMEALSAGITAVSRFSDLHETPESLMQSYSDLSPKVSRVMIIGENETIKELANFSIELNGAFLRLSAKREKFNAIHQQSQVLESRLESAQKELERSTALLIKPMETANPEIVSQKSQEKCDTIEKQITALKAKEEEVGNQLIQMIKDLVQTSMSEVAELNHRLVPLISLVRSELGLPFDEDYYAQIMEQGHQKLGEYLEDFFQHLPDEEEKGQSIR